MPPKSFLATGLLTLYFIFPTSALAQTNLPPPTDANAPIVISLTQTGSDARVQMYPVSPTFHGYTTLWEAIQNVITDQHKNGHVLKSCSVYSVTPAGDQSAQVTEKALLIFDQITTQREQLVLDIVNSAVVRMDSLSHVYVDSAMNQVNANVLKWLSDIPNQVLTAEYKEDLHKKFMNEVDLKIQQAITACKQALKPN